MVVCLFLFQLNYIQNIIGEYEFDYIGEESNEHVQQSTNQ